MEIYKLMAVVFAVIAVLYSVQVTAEGGNDPLAACTQKLLPCQPYIHKVNPPPPPSCCGPMKEILDKDTTCLCAVFNNPLILKTLNLTKENALDLPKACGLNPNVSVCNETPPSSTTGTPESTKGNSSAPTLSFSGLISFLTALVAIIIIFF